MVRKTPVQRPQNSDHAWRGWRGSSLHPIRISSPIVTPCVVTRRNFRPGGGRILLVTTSKAENISAWILAVFLALLFTSVGAAKLISMRGMVQEFEQTGLGQWLRYFTGALEVTGGIGLLIPKIRFWLRS